MFVFDELVMKLQHHWEFNPNVHRFLIVANDDRLLSSIHTIYHQLFVNVGMMLGHVHWQIAAINKYIHRGLDERNKLELLHLLNIHLGNLELVFLIFFAYISLLIDSKYNILAFQNIVVIERNYIVTKGVRHVSKKMVKVVDGG
jgi:hypothetical protein